METTSVKQYVQMMNKNMRNYNKKPEDFYYYSVYDFVSQEGMVFKSQKLTGKEMKIVKDAIDCLSFEPKFKECYYNSQMLAISDLTDSIHYVEGFALDRFIPLNHGWCEINDKVIDITWRENNDTKGKFIFGEIENRDYYGVKFNTETLRKVMVDSGWAKTFLDDWMGDFEIFKKKFKQV